jgi:hypothetical protein
MKWNSINVKTLSSLPGIKAVFSPYINDGIPGKIKLSECLVPSATNLVGNVGKAVEVGIRILNSKDYGTSEYFGISIDELNYLTLDHDDLWKVENKLLKKKNVTSLELAQLSINLVNNLYIKQFGADQTSQVLFISHRMIKEVEAILNLYRSKGTSFQNGLFNVDLSIPKKLDAEADLIIDDQLIEIKTIASKGLQKAHFYQCLIYFTLAKNKNEFKNLRYFSIYLTRQNQLIKFDSEIVFRNGDFPKMRDLILKEIEGSQNIYNGVSNEFSIN